MKVVFILSQFNFWNKGFTLKKLLLCLTIFTISMPSFAKIVRFHEGADDRDHTQACEILEKAASKLRKNHIDIEIERCEPIKDKDYAFLKADLKTTSSYPASCDKYRVVKFEPSSLYPGLGEMRVYHALLSASSGVKFIAATGSEWTELNSGRHLLIVGIPACD